MNTDQLAQKIENWCWRVAGLQQRSGKLSLPQQQLATEAFEELGAALEELQVAEEELRQQNSELADARALVEAERQRYQELFEFAPDGYLVTDPHAMIREANRAAAALLNVSEQFLVGKPLTNFIPNEERRAFRSQLNRLHQLERVQDWEIRLCRRNGAVFDAALTIATVRDRDGCAIALRVCVRDITSRKRSEELLQQQTQRERLFAAMTQRLRDSLDESQILQTAVDELAVVLGLGGCNAVLYDLADGTSTIRYKYTTSSSLSPECIVPYSDFPEVYHQLLQGQPFQFCELDRSEEDAVRSSVISLEPLSSPSKPHGSPNSRGRQVVILACPILNDQEVLGDLCLLNRLPEAFLESEIRLVQQVANQCAIAIRQARLYKATQAQVEELAKLNQLKDDFLSTVSHELRTPVSNMKVAIRMLEITLKRADVTHLTTQGVVNAQENCYNSFLAIDKPKLPAPFFPSRGSEEYSKVVHYVQILKDECEQEISLINDLLDLQRLKAGTQPKELEPIQLQDWLLQEVKPFEERTKSRGQSLLLDISPELPDLVCDPSSLKRILAELLNNACKYTPSEEKITVSARAYPAAVQVRVTNSGVEIPKSELPHIFEKFYRIPSADRWKQGGTGLGLALVQKLTEHLGATLQVESNYGKTTFTIEFPIGQRLAN